MISLKKRLALTYTLFTSASLLALAAGINVFSGIIFEKFIRQSISERSGEIVRLAAELYHPMRNGFDIPALQTAGMIFLHDGFVIDIEDSGGNSLWDARTMNMKHCVEVLQKIAGRMRTEYGVDGGLQNVSYPVVYGGVTVGRVNIASYGPFFYTESQGRFILSLNRLLLACALGFIVLGIWVSVILAQAIAGPVNKAGEAARRIARFYAGRNRREEIDIRIRENYKTRELAELSRSINELGRELAEGERRQKQLTSDIAHELRTPLTCLQGTMEALMDKVWEATPERLASCYDETKRLSKMVEDLTLLTGLEWEKTPLNKSSFDMKELLERAAEQFAPAVKEKGIELLLSSQSVTVHADYDRIMQVIINLVSNAVKYTDKGRITITCEAVPAGNGGRSLLVTVKDTGAGIPKEDLPRIFERFYRTDKSRNRNTGGSGIGLTIASAIVAAHGWSIDAASENGRGSEFRITAPLPGGVHPGRL